GWLQGDPGSVAATALCAHPRPVGGRVAGQQGSSDRSSVARGLRPLHALLDRLRAAVPRRLHRRLPVHLREIACGRFASLSVAVAPVSLGAARNQSTPWPSTPLVSVNCPTSVMPLRNSCAQPVK